jgi:hypothetical protein
MKNALRYLAHCPTAPFLTSPYDLRLYKRPFSMTNLVIVATCLKNIRKIDGKSGNLNREGGRFWNKLCLEQYGDSV